jgi:hypothetical protein
MPKRGGRAAKALAVVPTFEQAALAYLAPTVGGEPDDFLSKGSGPSWGRASDMGPDLAVSLGDAA